MTNAVGVVGSRRKIWQTAEAVFTCYTRLSFHYYVPSICQGCHLEIQDGQVVHEEDGVQLCEVCYTHADTSQREPATNLNPKCCSKCGRDAAEEIGKNRDGKYVCDECKSNPLDIVKRILHAAKSGDDDLTGIQGYAIKKLIKKGGMGAVYLAKREASDELVALKVMLPRVAADQRATDLFLREAKYTQVLDHSNCVRSYEAGCSEGTFFLTLEYCEKGSIQDLMDRRGGKLTIDEATPLIMQTLDGLNYAHNVKLPPILMKDGTNQVLEGLVHRDLSPNNIFLKIEGGTLTAKVADFGLAKAFDFAGLSGQTRTGSVAGKPVFTPRQQVVNFKYCQPDVDVWAAAACFYHMLTGKYPRDFRKNQDPWRLILTSEPVPIRKRNRKIPKPLAEVLDTALRDSPKLCFKSAIELKQALGEVL